jgi:hypothetical protein
MPALIVALILGSIGGFLYSFWILFTVILIFAVGVSWNEQSRLCVAGNEVIERVKLYEAGEGPRPNDEELRIAAEYLSNSEFSDFRRGDDAFSGIPGFHYPVTMNAYLPSATKMPRRFNNWRGFERRKAMEGAEDEVRRRLRRGEAPARIACFMALNRRVHPDDIREVMREIERANAEVERLRQLA